MFKKFLFMMVFLLTTSLTLAQENTAPYNIQIIGSATVEEESLVTIGFKAIDDEQDNLIFDLIRATNLGPKEKILSPDKFERDAASPNFFTWRTDINDEGIYRIGVRATDSLGASSENSFKITIINKDAILSADFNKDGIVNHLDFFLFLENINKNNLEYDLNSDGQVDINDFKEFTNQLGDTIRNVSENTPPKLDPIEDKTINEGEELRFTLLGSDLETESHLLTYSAVELINPLPEGISLIGDKNQIVTWTPSPVQSGTYKITFSVSDGEKIDIQTTTITVKDILPKADFNKDGKVGIKDFHILIENMFTNNIEFDLTGDGFVDLKDLKELINQFGNSTSANSPPKFNPIENKSINEGELLKFTLSATDKETTSESLKFSILDLFNEVPKGIVLEGKENQIFSWTPTFDQSGSYKINLAVNDKEGKIDIITVNINVKDVNRPPILEIENTIINLNEGGSATFKVTATDPDKDSVTLGSKNLPKGSTFTGGIFLWKPSLSQSGSYKVTFTANDGLVTVEKLVTINVKNINRPPILEIENVNTNINEGDLITFKVSATDSDNDKLTYEIQNKPEGAIFENQEFRWTPNFAQSGIYIVDFKVSDGTSTSLSSVKITVTDMLLSADFNRDGVVDFNDFFIFVDSFGSDLSNYDLDGDGVVNFNDFRIFADQFGHDIESLTAPKVTPIEDITISEGESIVLFVSAIDPNGDSASLIYKALNLPHGATFIKNKFTWTPSFLQSGVYEVLFQVTDVEGKTSIGKVKIIVGNVNQGPSLGALGDITVKEGKSVIINPSATDVDGDLVTYTVSDSRFVQETSNRFVWKTTLKDSGTYFVIVRATTSDGKTDSKELKIEVKNKHLDHPEVEIKNAEIFNKGGIVQLGDDLELYINIRNTGNTDDEDARISFEVPELNIFQELAAISFDRNEKYIDVANIRLGDEVVSGEEYLFLVRVEAENNKADALKYGSFIVE